jgi:hypothetical protein
LYKRMNRKSSEELFLGALFFGDELDVIDQQNIDSMETVAEADHSQSILLFCETLFIVVEWPFGKVAPPPIKGNPPLFITC